MKTEYLKIAVVSQESIDTLNEKLEEIKVSLDSLIAKDIKNQWISSEDIPKILGICNKTWFDYRKKRLIGFSQIGSKIYVSRKDLDEFMEKNKRHAI